MAVNITLQSPGFYAREVEIFPTAVRPNGFGAGVVGTSDLGPAFVPVTLGNTGDLNNLFGTSNGVHQGIIAATEYLAQGGQALTYMRVLGAGTAPRVIFEGANAYLSHTPNAGFVAGFSEYNTVAIDDDWLEENVSQISSSLSFSTELPSTLNADSNVFFLGGVFNDSALSDSLSAADLSYPKIKNLQPLLEGAGDPGQFSTTFLGSYIKSGVETLTAVTGSTVLIGSTLVAPYVTVKSLTDGVTATVVGTTETSFGIDLGGSNTARVAYSVFDCATTSSFTGHSIARGVLFTKNGYVAALSSTLGYSEFGELYDIDGGAINTPSSLTSNYEASRFKLAILSGTTKNKEGFYVPTTAQVSYGPVLVSMNPNENAYFGKLLNVDPSRFDTTGHMLYSNFDVLDSQLHLTGTISGTIDLASSGSTISMPQFSVAANTAVSGTLQGKFLRYTPFFCVPPEGNYNRKWHNYIDRFSTPVSPMIISQGIGGYEYDLFRIKSRHDGKGANTAFKIGFTNIKFATSDTPEYPTFSLVVRAFNDTDRKPIVLESFVNINLNPASERFIAKIIGDSTVYLDLDQPEETDRKLVSEGNYDSRSSFISIEPTEELINGLMPIDAVPFGFAGVEVLNLDTVSTNPSGFNTYTTSSLSGIGMSGSNMFLSLYGNGLTFSGSVEGSYRGIFTAVSGNNTAQVGTVLNEWIPVTTSTIFYVSSSFTASNPFQFFGNVSGTFATANGTEFTVSQVVSSGTINPVVPPVPYRQSLTRGSINSNVGVQRDLSLFWGFKTEETDLSSPLSSQDPNASQIPNGGTPSYLLFYGVPETDNLYTGFLADSISNNKFSLSNVELGPTTGVSLAALNGVSISDVTQFRYKRDGVNPNTGSLGDVLSLDRKNRSLIFNKISAAAKFTVPVRGGFDGVNILNRDRKLINNTSVRTSALSASLGESPEIFGYNEATRLMLDHSNTDVEVFSIPGISEPLVTDNAIEKTENYFDAIYIMDPEQDNIDNINDFVQQFAARSLDTNFAATYFPNVIVRERTTNRVLEVSPSAVVLGAIALNDKIGQPWFAPAGLSRGALSSVINSTYRLKVEDRDSLYENGINPIISLPQQGFVVWGQKTLSQTQNSVLNRVNVRRLMIRIRRVIKDLSNTLLFDQYTQTSVDRLRALYDSALKEVQKLSGITAYRIELTPNFRSNTINGKITIIPTKTVEFVTIDFIVDKSGVSFG